MGDPRRFHAFADLIQKHIPLDAKIGDIAGGKGYLQAALFQRGYRNVTTWDVRKRCASPRRGYRHSLFDYRTAPSYDAVVGMHPDGATDQLLQYAAERHVPALIVPCCAIGSVNAYWGARGGYREWMDYLKNRADYLGLSVIHTALSINGRNEVLICRPS